MIQLIRGFKDILPGEVELWQHIERTAIDLFAIFGYGEIRVPIMEKTDLFARGIGEDTDIVEKEMYTFADRSGDQLTLRPEATASIVRSYIQHKMYANDPVCKFYTIGPMFRRERPQKGRYRQFYQIDAEVFGIEGAFIDAQMIYMLNLLFARLGVRDIQVHVNSLGCPQCRPAYREALLALLDDKDAQLCPDCRRRKARNPLRVLDCKVPTCQAAVANAPAIMDYLCQDCAAHFQTVTENLEKLEVPFILDKRLVRGLDYYTRTTFEVQTTMLGAQSAVAGGGRYDGLVQTLGGPATPAIGFAVGFDRLVEILSHDLTIEPLKPTLFVAALGAQAKQIGFQLSAELANAGYYVEMEHADKSLKAQMKRANRSGAEHVLIVGESELEQGEVVLRNMQTKEQVQLALEGLPETLKPYLRSKDIG